MLLKYFFAWFGMMALAIINGGMRDFAYKQKIGDLAAHQISTVALIILLAGYFSFLTRLWPIKSAAQRLDSSYFLLLTSYFLLLTCLA